MTRGVRRRAAARILAFVLAAGVGCASSGGAELGKPVTLKVGERAAFDDERVAVTFLSVPEDSRCPKDGQCVWAGNARVVLEVSRPGREAQTVSLDTTRGPRQTEFDGLVLRLEALAPERSSGHPLRPEDYRATLSVRRP